MSRGAKPGERRGGRAAGTPNKPKPDKALVRLDQAEAEVRFWRVSYSFGFYRLLDK